MRPFVTLMGGLAAVWALTIAVTAVGRLDAPMNDDTFYARSAFLFAAGDGPHYWGATTMPLFGQWAWSWPFLKVLGASHLSLRASTIVLSFVGVAAFYDLLVQSGLTPARAAFVAACLAVNPLYFLLSATYMADVPSLGFSLAAMALYGRALGGGRWQYLAGGVAFALLGAVTRQQSVAVPVAAGLMLLGKPQLRVRPAWVLGVAAPLAVAVATHLWLKTRGDVYLFDFKPPVEPRALALVCFTATVYLGLAALPALVLEPGAGSRGVFVAASGVLLALAAYAWASDAIRNPYTFIQRYDGHFLFPYTGNMIGPWGPCADVKNHPIVLGALPRLLTLPARLALSAVGCVSGAALLLRGFRGLGQVSFDRAGRRGVPLVACPPVFGPRLGTGGQATSGTRIQWHTQTKTAPRWSALTGPLPAFTAVNFGLILLIPPSHSLVDRYLLPLVPGALLLACGPAPDVGRRWKSGLTLLGAFGLISLGLTHDWFGWNAARWAVGRRALERGVAAHEIEGGYEFNRENYLRAYDRNRASFRDREPVRFEDIPGVVTGGIVAPGSVGPPGLSLDYARPITTGRYGLSFSVLPGTKVLDSEPFALWLVPGGPRRFYLVETTR